jgi:hypothetical protein
MKRLRIKDIAQWLPEKCWVMERSRAEPGVFDKQEVLYTQGDVEAKVLDLDTWGRAPGDDAPAPIIVIDGALRAEVVFNHLPGACTGLVVLGDMDVGSMVVGGQELYVGGELKVSQLFWGDGALGRATVVGGVTARLMMATHAYRLPYGNTEASGKSTSADKPQARLIDQEDRMDNEADVAARYFEADVLRAQTATTASFADVVDRALVIAALQRPQLVPNEKYTAQGILKAAFTLLAPPVIPRVWGDGHFLDKATLQAQQPHWQALFALLPIQAASTPSASQPSAKALQVQEKFRSQHDDATVCIGRQQPEPDSLSPAWAYEFMLVLIDDGPEIRLGWDIPGKLQSKLGMKPQLRAIYKQPDAGVTAWTSALKSPTVMGLLSEVWDETLRRAEAGLYWRAQIEQRVRPDDVLALVHQPVVVEHYNDLKNPERNGFWDGPLRYFFHVPSTAESWAMIRIARERKDTAKRDLHAYDFLLPRLNAESQVQLLYKSSQNGTPLGWSGDPYCRHLVPLSLFDGHKMQEALGWFERCQKRLPLHSAPVAAPAHGDVAETAA